MRQAVIDAHLELQERELVKLAARLVLIVQELTGRRSAANVSQVSPPFREGRIHMEAAATGRDS
ncbi:hypothetical protein [Streptomyces sp. NBC_01262]|uniref:hypothetical protein n=1 Tax=Streptomyces sp. NBC_01262 TaxID=2903803 RepID=UPI002E35F2DD|nr:hypothetical protein [Streptomyces sp. NBC_01262]